MTDFSPDPEASALRAAVFRIAAQNGMRTPVRPENGAANTGLVHEGFVAGGGGDFAVTLDADVPNRDRVLVGGIAGRMVVRALRRAGFRVEVDAAGHDRIFRVLPREA